MTQPTSMAVIYDVATRRPLRVLTADSDEQLRRAIRFRQGEASVVVPYNFGLISSPEALQALLVTLLGVP